MRQIAICTSAHARELTDFCGGPMARHVTRRGQRSGEYFIVIPENALQAGPFLEMMQDIVLEENPVVKGKSKLTAALKCMVSESARLSMTAELEGYVRDHDRLHIEGYIRFRLATYEYLISGILYSIVKRNLYIRDC